MTSPVIDDQLEELWEAYLPCDGISALDVPPHDAPAEWVLAKQHDCRITVQSAKCGPCYRRFKAHLDNMFEKWGVLECEYCQKVFTDPDSFVEYWRI